MPWEPDGTSSGWIGGGEDGWRTGIVPGLVGLTKSFSYPRGIFVDDAGFIYVADTGHDRVVKWDPDGEVVGWIGDGRDGWRTTGLPAEPGGDLRSFHDPRGVWVTPDGTIFVVHRARVVKWTADGEAVGMIGGETAGWQTEEELISGDGWRGFGGASDLAVDGAGRIYVSVESKHRISVWSGAGQPLGWLGGGKSGFRKFSPENWDSKGRGRSSFEGPTGLWISGGNLYVADKMNSRVSRWRVGSGPPTGTGWIGHGTDGWQSGNVPKARYPEWTSSDVRALNAPTGVAVTAEGDIYVVDEYGKRIVKWKVVSP